MNYDPQLRASLKTPGARSHAIRLVLLIGISGEAVIKRCAIYTRKSSHEGLEQSLNSLHAQRHFCESYIKSQAGEGWAALETLYDDGGFSGGSLDRPAIRRLMTDIAAGLVDAVVVYKIDRLSRSLVDFSSLLGRFEANKVDFVAVTQAFNTTSSMGRLTLNVLLSFSQFERELASERLRDKAAATRAQGLWLNGRRPFGYRLDKGRLTIDPVEAETVRSIFRRYVQLRSTRLVAEELNRRSVKNGAGTDFSRQVVTRLLRNRVYRGNLVHDGVPVPGAHEAIITEGLWVSVRKTVEQVIRERRPGLYAYPPHPFKGLIFSTTGKAYSQNAHFNRYGQLFRYYIPAGRKRYGAGSDPRERFKADAFDDAVLAAVGAFVPLQDRDKDGATKLGAVRRLIARIEIGEDEMAISFRSGAIVVADLVGRVRTTKPRSPCRRPGASPA